MTIVVFYRDYILTDENGIAPEVVLIQGENEAIKKGWVAKEDGKIKQIQFDTEFTKNVIVYQFPTYSAAVKFAEVLKRTVVSCCNNPMKVINTAKEDM